jgi:hypothetical protein
MNVRDNALAPGVIHDILSNSRRRAVLNHLKEESGTVEVRDLASRIAERESGESPPPRNVRKSVYNSLLQTHLPKLDREDVVEYDDDRKTVTISESARDVHVYMELVTPYGITWSEYYRLVAALSMIAVVVVHVADSALAAVDPLVVPVVGLVVVALSTAYQLWSRRSLYLQALFREAEGS